MTAHQSSPAALRRAALRAHRAVAIAGTAPAPEYYPAPIAARLAAAVRSGETAIHRFAPPQRDQALLGLQRTVGNGAVERLLRPRPVSTPAVQREEGAGEAKEVKTTSTPPPVNVPAPAPKEAGGKDKKEEEAEKPFKAVLGTEGEAATDRPPGGEAETEKGIAAKFAVKATIPLLKDAKAGPFLVLKEFELEGGGKLGWKRSGSDPVESFRVATMGGSLKALSLDFENVKPGLSIGFGAGIFAEGEFAGRNAMSFKVGGQIGAEAKYQFKDSPFFVTAELQGKAYWGALKEDTVRTTFTGASYSGSVGVGFSWGGPEKKK